MINIIRKEECSGCVACVDICPTAAISLKTDSEGFWYPVVDLELCIDCDLCDETCPIINAENLNQTNKQEPILLASYNTNTEIRVKSTSGGVFSALADKMYDMGGFVGGAVFTELFGAKHILSNKRIDLEQIRGSKYFQSNSSGLYISIQKALKAGEKVLVCGNPCYMAALRAFLRMDYENLIIVDFLCHSLPSPIVFRKYLDFLENEYNSKVVSFHPKNKETGGWHDFSFKAVFESGEIYNQKADKDLFTMGFVGPSNLLARPSCYECKFRNIPRVSDITLADFWGIENIDKEMDSTYGTSLVFLNSQKGIDFYNSLGSIVENREYSIDKAIYENSRNKYIYNQIPRPSIKKRDQFYNDLNTKPFDKCIYKYCTPPVTAFSVIKSGLRPIKKIIKKAFDI